MINPLEQQARVDVNTVLRNLQANYPADYEVIANHIARLEATIVRALTPTGENAKHVEVLTGIEASLFPGEAKEAMQAAIRALSAPDNATPYACDYCGKEYGKVACCETQYRYLRKYGEQVAPPVHDNAEAVEDDDTPSRPTELQIEYARGYSDGVKFGEQCANPTPAAAPEFDGVAVFWTKPGLAQACKLLGDAQTEHRVMLSTKQTPAYSQPLYTHPPAADEAMGRDAARYRWLRSSALEVSWNDWVSYSPGYTMCDADLMDAAIDAAMRGTAEEERD